MAENSQILQYASFSDRFWSLLLDRLLFLPLSLASIYLSQFGKSYFLLCQFLNLPMTLFMSVFMVVRFGGSPGKLLNKLKIVGVSGTGLGWKEALLRESMYLFFLCFYLVLQFVAFEKLDSPSFALLDSNARSIYYYDSISIAKYISWLLVFAYLSELAVVFNRNKRRSVQDIIGKTVVVKT